MNLMRASWFTATPYLVAALLSIAIGRISDRSLHRHALEQGKRRILLIVCIVFSSAVLLTDFVRSEFVAIGLIAVSLTSVASALTLNVAMTNDLVWNAEMSGTAMGIVILGGNLFGLIAPIATGYVVKTSGAFDGSFYLAGALLLCGAVVAGTMTKQPLSFSSELS
jgi:MFS family permease